MAKAKLINKKTQEIRVLDDSYVRIFPNTWDYAPKKGAPAPELAAEPVAKDTPVKKGAPAPELAAEPVAKDTPVKKVGK